MRVLLSLIVLLLAASACGTSQISSAPSSSTATGGDQVSGVYLRHGSDQRGGTPAAGVTIGVYLRPILTAGPIMADPPSPVARAVTDASGHFHVAVSGHRRVFLAPIGETAYAIGRWVAVGGPPVTLTGCTDCMRPLVAAPAASSG